MLVEPFVSAVDPNTIVVFIASRRAADLLSLVLGVFAQVIQRRSELDLRMVEMNLSD